MQPNVIQQYGDHFVSNASVDHEVVDELASISPVNVLYSDPPWGDGNLKYWVTMNKKMTGAEYPALTYHQLMARLDHLIKNYVNGYVFIETGSRWSDEFEEHFSYLYNVRIIELEYMSSGKLMKNPCLFGGTSPEFRFDHQMVKLRDAAAVKEIIGAVAKPGDTVLDPCCGMGYTAQACVDLGLKFRGNEFNSKRLLKTIARLK